VPVRWWRRLAWWRRRETHRELWARMGIETHAMQVVRVEVSQGLTMGKR
jgi:ABC-type antimicrobial peptide transport system ATPase subunit